ncbi:MAG TPA: hypothetical protein VME17_16230 [Bryobacteraceae bacterium]|nr:hypothetical protein [Bryobacteraceae bacterium]
METAEIQKSKSSVELAADIIAFARTLSSNEDQLSSVLMVASQLVAIDRQAFAQSDPKSS